jgi:hypothetical protein
MLFFLTLFSLCDARAFMHALGPLLQEETCENIRSKAECNSKKVKLVQWGKWKDWEGTTAPDSAPFTCTLQ